jgi:hypothetical protein
MADPLSRTDPVGLVRARLCTRFPDNAAEVNRQIDLAMACAERTIVGQPSMPVASREVPTGLDSGEPRWRR